MGWSLTTHRCVRPSVTQVEETGAGIGSIWVCATCHAAFRVADFDMSPVAGDHMQASVRWEVVRYGDVGKRRRLTTT